ncbi:MAG: exodeoxyribonuclease VII large subunit, partial [Bacteroidota bacterium]
MARVGQHVARKAHSLLDLTENIKLQIEKTYKTSYWIKAEINRLNYYPQSGHCYPELVEKKNGKIVAEIRGFLFRNLYEEIDQNFLDQTGKHLGDGMEVLLLCRVSFDPKYGLSLYISDIDPSYTLGEMARLREEAIKLLKVESILDKNKTTHLPYPVRRIAVVSVETSKGWRDFIQTLESNHYGHLIGHELFPAKLQGDMAVASIRAALAKIEKRSSDFEAVAIIRGGGGETGMDCYDQYELAK